MPLSSDLLIETEGGLTKSYHIPLLMSRGHKPIKAGVRLLRPWSWADENYFFEACLEKNSIVKIVIDPSNKSADIDRVNNSI